MNNLIIIGAGGHAISCIDVILSTNKYKIYGIIDKNKNPIEDFKYLGGDEVLPNYFNKCKRAFIGIGQIKSFDKRIKIFEKLKKYKFKIPKVISPKSSISNFSSIEEGSIIMHQSHIGPQVKIGKNCIINTSAVIEHGSNIEDFCHISTNVTLNGEVKIGKGSFIGSGTIIKEGIKIPPFSFIKMGSIVTKNISKNE